MFVGLLLVAASCGDDTGTPSPDLGVVTPGGDMNASMGPDMATPPCTTGPTCAPVLGAQIDRMGRAGVNTAVTDPFWDNGNAGADVAHHAKQDRYNQEANPANWAGLQLVSGDANSTVLKVFQANLAVYDAVNGTSDGTMANDGCGDQLAFNATVGGTNYPAYQLLATVLTDDELYVNTGSGTCSDTGYLAVEASVLKGTAPTDCGGRTPTHNTIDITYNAFINGFMGTQVSNGITVDPDPQSASNTTFPFLGTPN
jgi:hypothetical protein